jgi:hypothetical protein
MKNETNETKLGNRILAGKCESVKLGVEVHARELVVAIQLDGAQPQRAQKFTRAQLLGLVRRLVAAGRRVYVCQAGRGGRSPPRTQHAYDGAERSSRLTD